MRTPRLASILAAVTLAAGLSAVAAPSAYAGMKDCVKQAKAAGVHKADAKTACSYAKGGDVPDCVSMVQHDSGNNLYAAESACQKATPKHR